MRWSRNRRSIGLRARASAARKCSRALSCLPLRKFELAERGGVERIVGEAIAVGDGADLFEPALWTVALRDRDGAVERDNR